MKEDLTSEEIALIAAGLGTSAYSFNQMRRNAGPGGFARMTADHADNFLSGFYNTGKAGKLGQYGLEYAKTMGRLPHSSLGRISEAIAYKNTGVSRLLANQINDIDGQVHEILERYIHEGGDKATKRELKALINKAHHKVTSDFANQMMLGGKESKAISKYAGNYLKQSSVDDFIKLTGDKDVARYVLSRQGRPGKIGRMFRGPQGFQLEQPLKLIQYQNVPFANVLRGAQFHRPAYDTMTAIEGIVRNSDKVSGKDYAKVLNAIQNTGGVHNLTRTKSGKLLFEFSPSMKPNYDWGGYNAVMEWDPRNAKKIKIHATDARDVAFGYKGGGANSVNFVKPQTISIPKAKEIIMEDAVEKVQADKQRKERSDKNVKRGPQAGKLDKRIAKASQGLAGFVDSNSIKRYNEMKSIPKSFYHSVKMINKNLYKFMSPSNKFAMMNVASRGGVVGGGIMAALALKALMEED